MANKKLNSITFPNLPNDTYYLDADKVHYDATDTYADGSTGKALQNKAEIDGYYENLGAGTADNLATDIRSNDKTPYLFRTAGGSVDIGDREYVKGIVGGSVAWNQLVRNGNFAVDASYWSKGTNVQYSLSNGVMTATPVDSSVLGNRFIATGNYMAFASGHKMLVLLKASTNLGTIAAIQAIGYSSGYHIITQKQTIPCGTSALADTSWCFELSSSDEQGQITIVFDGRNELKMSDVMLIDLTQMFGSSIADYIYSLETSEAGKGVAWFKKLFNKPYYAYNAGELKSVSGLVSHDMTGFNQWGGEYESGYIYNGNKYSSNDYWRTKNFIKVVPNVAYYFNVGSTNGQINLFDANKAYIGVVEAMGTATQKIVTIPSNCEYVKFYQPSTVSPDTCCLNISWDGSRNGEYEPYELHSYSLDSDLVLHGIPKLDANNGLYYDGDTYEADGTVTRKYEKNTFTSVLSGYTGAGGQYIGRLATGVKAYDNGVVADIISDRFLPINANTQYGASGANYSTIAISQAGELLIHVVGCTDLTSLNTYLGSNSVTVVYPLATPTTETADPYQQVQLCDDFGTEEWVLASGTFPMPVGHDTDYPVNLKSKLEMAPNSPDGDGVYVVKQTSGTNEYVPLVIPSGIPSVPSTDGTYALTATVSSGTTTLTWEAQE